MAENNPTNAFEKTIKFNMLVTGRDEMGKFISKASQIKGLSKLVEDYAKEQEKLRKGMDKATKGVMAGLKRENKALRGKDKLQLKMSKAQAVHIKQITKAGKLQERILKKQTRLTQRSVNQQIRLERKLSRTRERLSRKARGARGSRGGGGGGGFGRFALPLAGLGLGYAATRQLQSLAGARRSLAVSGGLGALQNVKQNIGKDVAIVSGAQLVDQFLQQGTAQLSLGRQPVITKGLLRLQEQMSGIGTDLASKIILDLSNSFKDPKRLQGFLGAVGGGANVEQSLRGYQTQGNITETLRALNALQISQVESTGDPILDGQRELSKAAETLKAEFEKLADTLSGDLVPILKQLIPELQKLMRFVGGLSTKELAIGAGVGLGALAVGPALAVGAGKLGAKGLVRGAGALLPKAIPAGLGLSKAGLAGAGALAAPIALGGALAIHSSKRTEQSLSEALRGSERESAQVGNLDRLATRMRLSATTDRERLTAQRLRLDRLASGITPGATERSFLFGDRLSGEYTPQQERQLETLGSQRRALQAEIDSLQSRAQTETKAISAKQKETKAVEKAAKAVDDFAEKVKNTPTPKSKIEKDLSQLFKRGDLDLDAQLQQSQLNLARADLEIAKIGPYQILAAGPEAQRVLLSLNSQEDILRKILATLDTSTRSGKIQANQVRLEMKGLEREGKDLQRQLVNAYLDNQIQQVMQSHARSRSIIVTTQQAAGIGLRKGLFANQSSKLTRQLVGSIDPSRPKRKGRTALEILQERMNPPMSLMRQDVMDRENRNANAPTYANPFGGQDPNPSRSKDRNIPKPRMGNTSADSMINVGKYMIQIGEQQRQEDQEVQNHFAEPIGQYAANRLNSTQAISP